MEEREAEALARTLLRQAKRSGPLRRDEWHVIDRDTALFLGHFGLIRWNMHRCRVEVIHLRWVFGRGIWWPTVEKQYDLDATRKRILLDKWYVK